METSRLKACEGKRKRDGDGILLLNSKKRKETLFRKCHELEVKSDADVSLVCIGPHGEIEAWPNHEKVKAMITRHREKQAGKNKENSESDEEKKKKAANDSAAKLSAESLMSVWREIDSKLETLDEKIKILSVQKATDFCDTVNNSSGRFMDVYDWDDLSTSTMESYGQPQPLRVSYVQQLSPPTQLTEESMAAISVNTDYSFITDDLALNHIWEPQMESLLGAQDLTMNALQNYYLGSDWNHLLQ